MLKTYISKAKDTNNGLTLLIALHLGGLKSEFIDKLFLKYPGDVQYEVLQKLLDQASRPNTAEDLIMEVFAITKILELEFCCSL